MMSLTPLSAGQAGSYYTKDSYYAAERPGGWMGKAALSLGLQGQVEQEAWEAVLRGRDPRTGEQLVQVGANGEHRPATDLTFSPPKSVSVAALVGGRQDVIEAHRQAVDATLKYIEQHGAQARVTKDGVTATVPTNNLLIAEHEHTTSRELDPQLHTHCPVLNMTQMPDGSWKAISNEKFYDSKMFYGQYYRSELAANLKGLGYQIESGPMGLFEIKGVDGDIRDEFSRRKEQIEAKMEELRVKYPNANNSKLREDATLGSRAVKDHDVDMRDVRESWVQRLQEKGVSVEQLNHTINDTKAVNMDRESMNVTDVVRMAGQILTEQESTFTREDHKRENGVVEAGLLRIAAQLSVGHARIRDLDEATTQLIRAGELIQLSDGSLTTKEMYQIEHDTVQMMLKGQGRFEPVMNQSEIEVALKKRPHFTRSQGGAFEHVLTSTDGVIGIQGYAGVGKTTLLDAIRQELEARGKTVKGVAFSGKAADGIQSEAKIQSNTIARDSYKSERADYVFVDETSMAGSRDIHGVMKRAIDDGSRVILVGDTDQLQAIRAGRIFKDLQASGMATAIMPEIIRQKDGTYKDIVRSLVEKKIDHFFAALERTSKLHNITEHNARIKAIAKDYADRADYKNTIVLSGKNKDVHELNGLIRVLLKERGEIGTQDITMTVRTPVSIQPAAQHFKQSYKVGQYIFTREAGVGGLRAGTETRVEAIDTDTHTLTVGTATGTKRRIDLVQDGGKISVYEEREDNFTDREKIIFTKNDSKLKVRNGQMGEILKIDTNGKMIVAMQDGSTRHVDPEKYRFVNHGDAITTHKAQGVTEQNVIVNAPTDGQQTYNSMYVQATRGRRDLQIYTDDPEKLKDLVMVEQKKTSSIEADKSQGINGQTKSTPRDQKEDLIKGTMRGQDRETAELKAGHGGPQKGDGAEEGDRSREAGRKETELEM